MNTSKYITLFVKALVGVVLLSGLGACSGGARDSYHISGAIDSLLTPTFPANAPGAVAMVAIGDSVIYSRSFGKARLDNDAEMSPSTLINVASSTKTFIAVAIMKLSEQGALSLDDRLVKYYPELPDSVFGEIKLRHILAHTSGIPDKRPESAEQWVKYLEENQSIFGDMPDYRVYGKEKELTRFLATVDSLNFVPGTGFERQDPPYMLLAGVIEQASGMSFESFMKTYVFAPAGVERFAFPTPGEIAPDMAHAYRRARGQAAPSVFVSDDGRWEEYDYGEAPFFLTKADRGLYISPRDFIKWYAALAGGEIISPAVRAGMRIPMVSNGKVGQGYSLGVNVAEDVNGCIRLYHRSSRGGFTAVEAIYPDSGVVYLIFSNRNDWPFEEIADGIEHILHDHGVIN